MSRIIKGRLNASCACTRCSGQNGIPTETSSMHMLELPSVFARPDLPNSTFLTIKGIARKCENTRSASPVFPQLGLEPNHAGLASQSLFLLEELLQSKTQWHSKTFSSSKNDLKEFRAHSNVFQSSQNKTSSTQTQNNLPNSSQNNMFLRHGSNNIQNTKNPQKKRKIHVQALPCTNWFHLVPNWFLRGSYLVPTVFDSSDGCSYKLKSHLLVLMHMQCSKIGLKMFK